MCRGSRRRFLVARLARGEGTRQAKRRRHQRAEPVQSRGGKGRAWGRNAAAVGERSAEQGGSNTPPQTTTHPPQPPPKVSTTRLLTPFFVRFQIFAVCNVCVSVSLCLCVSVSLCLCVSVRVRRGAQAPAAGRRRRIRHLDT